MLIIGLTGPTGSGKSAVSQILKENGAEIIDADKIAHEIILKGRPAYSELVAYFGDGILNNDGEIDRKTLGFTVFSQGGEKLEFLNSCTHKYIYDEMKKQLEAADKSGKQMAVIDAPLLIEGNFIKLCQKVWAVYADDCVRAKRIMGRDSITYEQAMDRMKRQKPWEVYKKYADIIIDNSTDIESLKGQVEYNLNNPGENNGKKQV